MGEVKWQHFMLEAKWYNYHYGQRGWSGFRRALTHESRGVPTRQMEGVLTSMLPIHRQQQKNQEMVNQRLTTAPEIKNYRPSTSFQISISSQAQIEPIDRSRKMSHFEESCYNCTTCILSKRSPPFSLRETVAICQLSYRGKNIHNYQTKYWPRHQDQT